MTLFLRQIRALFNMKLHPKLAKQPEDFNVTEFKRFKPFIKKDLARLEKQTDKDKPTDFFLIGKHKFKDKPTLFLPLLVFGKWKGVFKNFAKKTVVKRKEKDSLVGQAYYAGEEDGLKVIQLLIWKGKGKQVPLTKQLKKLLPKTHKLKFQFMEGDMPEDKENILGEEQEMMASMAGNETEEVKDKQWFRDNLIQISSQWKEHKTAIENITIGDKDQQESISSLAILLREWLKSLDESPELKTVFEDQYIKLAKLNFLIETKVDKAVNDKPSMSGSAPDENDDDEQPPKKGPFLIMDLDKGGVDLDSDNDGIVFIPNGEEYYIIEEQQDQVYIEIDRGYEILRGKLPMQVHESRGMVVITVESSQNLSRIEEMIDKDNLLKNFNENKCVQLLKGLSSYEQKALMSDEDLQKSLKKYLNKKEWVSAITFWSEPSLEWKINFLKDEKGAPNDYYYIRPLIVHSNQKDENGNSFDLRKHFEDGTIKLKNESDLYALLDDLGMTDVPPPDYFFKYHPDRTNLYETEYNKAKIAKEERVRNFEYDELPHRFDRKIELDEATADLILKIATEESTDYEKAQFLKMFKKMAVTKVHDLLDISEQQLLQELKSNYKGGGRLNEFKTEFSELMEQKFSGMIPNDLDPNDPTVNELKGLTNIEILAKKKEYSKDDNKKHNEYSLQIGYAYKKMPILKKFIDAVKNSICNKIGSKYPVLFSYEGEAFAQLYKLAKKDSKKSKNIGQIVIDFLKNNDLANRFEQKFTKLLANIAETRINVQKDQGLVWKLESVIDQTLSYLGIDKASKIGLLVLEKCKIEKAKEENRKLAIACLSLGLGILGAFTTGGVSLVLTSASIGVGAYEAIEEWDEYKVMSAASNTSLEKANALTGKDPSLLGFALSVMGIGLDVGSILQIIKSLKKIDIIGDINVKTFLQQDPKNLTGEALETYKQQLETILKDRLKKIRKGKELDEMEEAVLNKKIHSFLSEGKSLDDLIEHLQELSFSSNSAKELLDRLTREQTEAVARLDQAKTAFKNAVSDTIERLDSTVQRFIKTIKEIKEVVMSEVPEMALAQGKMTLSLHLDNGAYKLFFGFKSKLLEIGTLLAGKGSKNVKPFLKFLGDGKDLVNNLRSIIYWGIKTKVLTLKTIVSEGILKNILEKAGLGKEYNRLLKKLEKAKSEEDVKRLLDEFIKDTANLCSDLSGDAKKVLSKMEGKVDNENLMSIELVARQLIASSETLVKDESTKKIIGTKFLKQLESLISKSGKEGININNELCKSIGRLWDGNTDISPEYIYKILTKVLDSKDAKEATTSIKRINSFIRNLNKVPKSKQVKQVVIDNVVTKLAKNQIDVDTVHWIHIMLKQKISDEARKGFLLKLENQSSHLKELHYKVDGEYSQYYLKGVPTDEVDWVKSYRTNEYIKLFNQKIGDAPELLKDQITKSERFTTFKKNNPKATIDDYLKTSKAKLDVIESTELGYVKILEGLQGNTTNLGPEIQNILNVINKDPKFKAELLDLLKKDIKIKDINIAKLDSAREGFIKDLNKILGTKLDISDIRDLDKLGIPATQGSRGSLFEHWFATNQEAAYAAKRGIQKQNGQALRGGKTYNNVKGKTVHLDNHYVVKGSGKEHTIAVEMKNVKGKLGKEPQAQMERYKELIKQGKLAKVEYVFSSKAAAEANLELLQQKLGKHNVKVFYIDISGKLSNKF